MHGLTEAYGNNMGRFAHSQQLLKFGYFYCCCSMGGVVFPAQVSCPRRMIARLYYGSHEVTVKIIGLSINNSRARGMTNTTYCRTC